VCCLPHVVTRMSELRACLCAYKWPAEDTLGLDSMPLPCRGHREGSRVGGLSYIIWRASPLNEVVRTVRGRYVSCAWTEHIPVRPVSVDVGSVRRRRRSLWRREAGRLAL